MASCSGISNVSVRKRTRSEGGLDEVEEELGNDRDWEEAIPKRKGKKIKRKAMKTTCSQPVTTRGRKPKQSAASLRQGATLRQTTDISTTVRNAEPPCIKKSVSRTPALPVDADTNSISDACTKCKAACNSTDRFACYRCQANYHPLCIQPTIKPENLQAIICVLEVTGWMCPSCRQQCISPYTNTPPNPTPLQDAPGADVRKNPSISPAVSDVSSDRQRRLHNVVITGLAEPNSVGDQNIVFDLLTNHLGLSGDIREFTTKRLGTQELDRNRKTLVSFKCIDTAKLVLSKAKQLRQSLNYVVSRSVYIHADLNKEDARIAYEERCKRRAQFQRPPLADFYTRRPIPPAHSRPRQPARLSPTAGEFHPARGPWNSVSSVPQFVTVPPKPSPPVRPQYHPYPYQLQPTQIIQQHPQLLQPQTVQSTRQLQQQQQPQQQQPQLQLHMLTQQLPQLQHHDQQTKQRHIETTLPEPPQHYFCPSQPSNPLHQLNAQHYLQPISSTQVQQNDMNPNTQQTLPMHAA